MSYHTSYAFTAPADVVHDVVNDRVLLAGWLGEELSLARAPGPGDHDDVTRYRVEPGPSPFEVSWAPAPEPDGWAMLLAGVLGIGAMARLRLFG